MLETSLSKNLASYGVPVCKKWSS